VNLGAPSAPADKASAPSSDVLLQVDGLTKVFGGRRRRPWSATGGSLTAVEDLSFRVAEGETLGIVGESGSGKSTAARMITRLLPPTAGRVVLAGEDLSRLDHETLRRRRRSIQMVFQDPYSSLNPRIRVSDQIAEPLLVHRLASGDEAREAVAALMARVGLDPARARDFPHAFSGGQRQRIAIARALATAPRLVVADEAVSALDVSVRAQILNLLADLKATSRLSIVFISHDLGVVRHVADRVAVMYRGRLVEIAPGHALFATPRHPYTRDLLGAMPVSFPARRTRRRMEIASGGEEPAAGCPYAPRCRLAVDRCRRERPALLPGGDERHVACHRAADVEPPTLSGAARSAAGETRLAALQARFAAFAAARAGDA